MKKILLTITILFVTLLTMAQSPNLFNYQGVARNAVGNVLPNQSISLRLSILNGSSAGPVVYQETRTLLTNAFGLFNVVVGSPGASSVIGTIAGVNWTAFGAGSGNKYLQVELDPNGGSSFTNVGSTQMVSVPYALNAFAAAPVGPAGGDLTGTYPNPQILFPLIKTFSFPASQLIGMTNSSTTGTLGAITGSSNSSDPIATAILGTMSNTTQGIASAAVRGNNNGTGNTGVGVTGTHAGAGWGVYGLSQSGLGVFGQTTGGTGAGVYGQSTTGIGVYGISNTNNSGFFENTTATNTANTINGQSNGVGNVVSGINTGTGRGGFFQVNNGASTANALEVTTNGTGPSWGIRANSTGTNGAGLFVQQNPTNTANNVFSNQTGLGRAGLFQNTNVASQADVVTAITVSTDPTPAAVHGINGASTFTVASKKGVWGESDNGSGVLGTSSVGNGVLGMTNSGAAAISGVNTGNGTGVAGTSTNGTAAVFSLTSPNNSNVVVASTNGNGNVINASTSGAGRTSTFNNTNAANTSIANVMLNANTSSNAAPNGTLYAQRGALTAGQQFIVTDLIGTPLPTSIAGISSTGIGVQGASETGFGITGVSNSGFGTVGISLLPTGTGVGAIALGGGYALQTNGKLQFQGQGAALGKIMGANNVNGDATWQTAAALGLVSGSGTLFYIPKWNPNGTTLSNSLLYDNGSYVGLRTTTPTYSLDVWNNGLDGIRSKSTANYSVVDVDASNGDAAFRMYSNGVAKWNMRNDPTGNDYQIFQVGVQERMRILSANGYVGINTGPGVPGYQLQVNNSSSSGILSKSTAGFSVVDIDANNGDAAMRFYANGVAQWNVRNRPLDNYFEIFEIGGATRMVIQDATGNVGIGPNSVASYRLDVEHAGGTGIRSRSTTGYSVVDIDANNGDAALRYLENGTVRWNVRNQPITNNMEWFELGANVTRMLLQRATGNLGVGANQTPQHPLTVSPTATSDLTNVMVRGYGGAPTFWKGGAAFGFSSASVIMGQLNGVATIGGHNANLSGWAPLSINTFPGNNVGIGTAAPSFALEVDHNGTGILNKSLSGFSAMDIDAFTGDAAIRFYKAGVAQWNTRNNPITNDYQIFEFGGGERLRIEDGTGKVVVSGDFTALGVKLFTMDHPLDPTNKTLMHAAIESNEVLNSYSGNVVTDASGKITVSLPDYFEAINKDFRYQLTVVGGGFAQAIISKEISNNKFEIATNQPNIKVSWMVMGVRNDKHMQQNPFSAVEVKNAAQKGKYIDPKAWGMPDSKGVNYSGDMDGNSVNPKTVPAVKKPVTDNSGSVIETKLVVKPVVNSGSIAPVTETKVETKAVTNNNAPNSTNTGLKIPATEKQSNLSNKPNSTNTDKPVVTPAIQPTEVLKSNPVQSGNVAAQPIAMKTVALNNTELLQNTNPTTEGVKLPEVKIDNSNQVKVVEVPASVANPVSKSPEVNQNGEKVKKSKD